MMDIRRLLAALLVVSSCATGGGTAAPEPVDWQAQWIGAPWDGETYDRDTVLPAPEFRKTVDISSRVRRATAHVTGQGFFEFYVNGKKVGDEVLCPNETSYGHREGLENGSIPMDDTNWRDFRVFYLDYDLTELLHRGENTLSALVGNGFYATGRRRWVAPYGTPRFLCQVEVEYVNGSKDLFVSGPDWEVRRSPIVLNDVFEGEIYDARLEGKGEWEKAVVRKAPDGRLVLQEGPADKVVEVLEPKTVTRLGDGSWEVDFDDYVTGWVRLSGIDAPEGTEISVEFPVEGEDYNGVYKYVCGGSAGDSYAPRFSWWSFEKAIVRGWNGEFLPKNIRAEVVHSDIPVSASFDCSNPLLVRIHEIWKRTQTDNMHVGVPTDCPHREMGPYTGDGQVACVQVMHNFDADRFYRKWLRDISGCQDTVTGYVPNGAPWHPGCGGGVAWGAAMTIIPWEHYVHYGDISILEEHYEAMKAQLGYMEGWRTEEGIMHSQAPGGPENSIYWMNLGEWCPAYELPDDRLVHTYFLWKCANYVSYAAKALGKDEDAALYAALADDVREAFHRVFYRPETHSYGWQDGANVFALAMGVPPEREALVEESLLREIAENDGHLNTGIFGTQLFFDVLCDHGMADLAYTAMTKTDYPSYGWWLEQGAHTFWERWDGRDSRNHPMFGGGVTWLYTRLAGLQTDPEEPGYRHMIVKPTPVCDLVSASYETETPQGEASVRWEIEDGTFVLDVRVPKGSHASIWMPGAEAPVEYGSQSTFTEVTLKQAM